MFLLLFFALARVRLIIANVQLFVFIIWWCIIAHHHHLLLLLLLLRTSGVLCSFLSSSSFCVCCLKNYHRRDPGRVPGISEPRLGLVRNDGISKGLFIELGGGPNSSCSVFSSRPSGWVTVSTVFVFATPSSPTTVSVSIVFFTVSPFALNTYSLFLVDELVPAFSFHPFLFMDSSENSDRLSSRKRPNSSKPNGSLPKNIFGKNSDGLCVPCSFDGDTSSKNSRKTSKGSRKNPPLAQFPNSYDRGVRNDDEGLCCCSLLPWSLSLLLYLFSSDPPPPSRK